MKQRKKSFGMRISAFVLSFAMVCTLLAGVNVVAFAADDLDDTVSVQKFYFDATKGGNGEHIYTVDEDEISWYKSLPSWNDEGEAWKAPLFSEVPVYRVANYNTGEHLWITDKGYVDYLVGLGWTQEQGVAFYSDENEGVPVYRLWNGHDGVGSHHFTTNEDEVAWLVNDQGWTLEGAVFYGVDKEEPQDLEILSAEQTGANTIEFTVSRALALTDEVELLNGTTEQEMTYNVSEDGKTVEIVTVGKLSDATYTIAVTPEEAALPATEDVECEAEKLAGLAFGPGLAFVSNQNFYTVATSLNGANQWGEPFNLNSGTMKVYPGVAAIADGTTGDGTTNLAKGFTTGYDATKNQYVLAKSDTIPFKVGDMVSLTAVFDSGDGHVIQETDELPVVAVPNVTSMEFGDMSTTSPKLVGQRVTVKNFQTDSYYFPVEAYDQYGNELDKDSLNYALKTSMLFVNPTANNSAFGGFAGEFDELEDGTVIMKLAASPNQIPGKGTITVSAIGGLSTSASFEVEDNPYIASLSVVGLGDIIEGTFSTFGLVAIDQYGDLFDLYNTRITPVTSVDDGLCHELTFDQSVNTLTQQKASVKVTNGTLDFKKSSSKKQVGFIYIPKAGSKNDVMTLTTSVPSVNTVTLTIKEAGTPVSINKDLVNSMVNPNTRLTRSKSEATSGAGITLDLSPGGVQFVDTNGLEIGVPYVDVKPARTNTDQYYYMVKAEEANTPSAISVTGNGGLVTGIRSNAKATVTLYKMDKNGTETVLDTKEFKLKVTSGHYDNYTAVWQKGTTLYSGPATDHFTVNAYGAIGNHPLTDSLLVYGTDEYGVTALLIEGEDYFVTNNDPAHLNDAGVPLDGVHNLAVSVKYADGSRQGWSDTDVSKQLEGTADFTIWGEIGDSGDIDEVAEATIEYSNRTPVPVAWSWNNLYSQKEADESIDILPTDDVYFTDYGLIVKSNYEHANYGLFAVDQYLLPMAPGTPANNVSFSDDGVDVTNNNTTAQHLTQGTHTIKVNRAGLPEKTIYIVVR